MARVAKTEIIQTTTQPAMEAGSRPVINLSDEQLDIASAVQAATQNIVVRARAGTGKTFLLLNVLPLMSGEIAMVAYNRKIAREISLKLTNAGIRRRSPFEADKHLAGVDDGTFHSFGWRVLRRAFPGLRLEGRDGKDAAGFMKFEKLAERLTIPVSIQPLVHKAMARGQERLLELDRAPNAVNDTAAKTVDPAAVQQFLDDLVPLTNPAYQDHQRSIAECYRRNGWISDRQAGAVKINASKARLRIPAGLVVGKPATQPRPQQSQAAAVTNGLDPAWLDLANHYALEMDLPGDEHIDMQLLRRSLGRDATTEQARAAMLRIALEYAAKAIHESAKMAREEFFAETKVGRGENRRTVQGEKFTGVISFNEMLYLPLYFRLDIPQYDWVLVDEVQDSNAARREFARRMLKAKGRFLGVGDDRQAIYGFAGADNDAMEQIIRTFDCKVLPMTRTFRCGKAIVELAKRIVSDYKAGDANPEGKVNNISEDDFAKVDVTPRPDDTVAVICRNTAPLIRVAYKLLARNIRCHVEGRDIGKSLLPLLYRWPHFKSLTVYVEHLQAYRDAEVAKLMDEGKEAPADQLNDRVDAILAIIEAMPKDAKLSDVQERISALFIDTTDSTEKPVDVTLLTAHRAKGLEYDRVFGWGVNKFMPSKMAKTGWQVEQEKNLEYVLYTRAIRELTLVSIG